VADKPQESPLASVALNAFESSINDAIQILNSMRALEHDLQQAAAYCISSLKSGHKLLVCGNGGSASEAQHLAGELVGKYRDNRIALPALALTADSAVMTCIANDFSYGDVFARQVQAFGKPGDVLVAFSTSGQSGNVLKALKTARELQLTSVIFLGRDSGSAALLADCALVVPHLATARIQEGHQFLMHSMMDLIEAAITHDS
jgi:D-sedoheptulose 7-phosphate isomerase